MERLESSNDYTVGWVTALSNERAAAIGMLDKIHALPHGFKKAPHDDNAYELGSIGEHNIVIATLPLGKYGEVSAATTASNMLVSFPNIRIGLMVGIGAGVPGGKEDVRLGDVVVSAPDGKSGGVIQYDLGKELSDNVFERKGSLNAPPIALLNAVGALQTRHMLREPLMSNYVESMLSNNPLMRKPRDTRTIPFSRPAKENDRLFDGDYQHVGGSTCAACDPAQLVSRDERGTQDPWVFYGLIASGNKVIKDARARKKVLEDAGERCICIEMEAAGLMDSFPCIVIRGICDYADSHKNDVWHNYAAATAAAYAKELLESIPVVDMDKTPAAKHTIRGSTMKEAVTAPTLDGKPDDQSGKLAQQVQGLRNEVNELRSQLKNMPSSGTGSPHIQTGRASVQRRADGKGKRIYFRKPFGKPPKVTLTMIFSAWEYYYGQRVYLMEEEDTPSSTAEYFVVGIWGGGTDGRVGTRLEFDWIATEPSDA